MFKKILYLSFALFLIAFSWAVNSAFMKMTGGMLNQVYLYKSSSEAVIANDDFLVFFKKGESYIIDGEKDVNSILSFYNAKLVKTETTLEGTNYYAYSNEIKYKKVIDGQAINLHIFISNTKTVVGIPIIYGSF